MKTVLAASLIAFVLFGVSTPGVAAEPVETEAETKTVPDGSPAQTPSTDNGVSDGEADTSKDIMQNFTRHRPGACPEGPPCEIED